MGEGTDHTTQGDAESLPQDQADRYSSKRSEVCKEALIIFRVAAV